MLSAHICVLTVVNKDNMVLLPKFKDALAKGSPECRGLDENWSIDGKGDPFSLSGFFMFGAYFKMKVKMHSGNTDVWDKIGRRKHLMKQPFVFCLV